MITRNDKDILRYIERVGLCTSSHIAKIFYKDKSQASVIARRRLRRMEEHGYLRVIQYDKLNNRNIYIFNSDDNKKLKPSLGKILILDYHAELIYSGVEIKYFKPEQYWLGGTIKSDAFCIYTINDKPYFDLVEVTTSNNYRNLEKYNRLYDSSEVYKITDNVFPRVIVIDDNDIKKDYGLDSNIKVIRLDSSISPISSLFV